MLFEKSAKFADARAAVQVWYNAAKNSSWKNLEEIRKTFPATDMIGALAIFNIRGNRYRLIVRIAFDTQCVYVKEFLTHAEYDKRL